MQQRDTVFGQVAFATRRSVLGKGLRLALGVPAALAALRGGLVFANESDGSGRRGISIEQSGDGQRIVVGDIVVDQTGDRQAIFLGDDDDDDDLVEHVNPNPFLQRRLGASFGSRLCRVGDVPGGDFAAANAGSDTLQGGSVWVLRLSGDPPGRVLVRVRGAANADGTPLSGATYRVRFVPANGGSRVDLGTVTTGAAGQVSAALNLPADFGANRAGTFVLTRTIDGTERDEFVTCL